MSEIGHLPRPATSLSPELSPPEGETSHRTSPALPQSRTPVALASAQTNRVARTEEAQRLIADISAQLRQYFPGAEGIDEIINHRAAALYDMGETPQDIADTISKGKKLDYISVAAGGALMAFPFAVSGFASAAIKNGAGITGTSADEEALAGAVDGATAMVLKSVGDKVLGPAAKDSTWMTAEADMLEPAMQEVLKRREGLYESLKPAVLGGMGFNVRNAINTGMAVATHNNPNVVSHISNALSIATGGTIGPALSHSVSALHGPEFLFGRTDWLDRYQLLKNTDLLQQIGGGGAKRLKMLAGNLATPRNYAKGVMNIASGNMSSEIGTLAGGIAGVNAVRNVVRGGIPATSASAIGQDQLLNTGLSAIAYASQGVAGTLAGPAPTRNDESVDYVADQVVNSALGQATGQMRDQATEWAGNKLHEGKEWTGNKVNEGTAWAGSKLHEGKEWTGNKVNEGTAWAGSKLHEGKEWTGNKVNEGTEWAGSKLHEGKEWASNAMTSSSQWLAQQLRQQLDRNNEHEMQPPVGDDNV